MAKIANRATPINNNVVKGHNRDPAINNNEKKVIVITVEAPKSGSIRSKKTITTNKIIGFKKLKKSFLTFS